MWNKQLQTDNSVTVKQNMPFLPQVAVWCILSQWTHPQSLCLLSQVLPHSLAVLLPGLVCVCSKFNSNTSVERSGFSMLDRVSGTGMYPSFQVMFAFAEEAFKSSSIALGLSGPLGAQDVSFPTRWRYFRQSVSWFFPALLPPNTPAFPRRGEAV